MSAAAMSRKTPPTCGIHRQHPLTEVDCRAVHWSFCGLCEAEAARRFVDRMRDPDLKARFEAALSGRRR